MDLKRNIRVSFKKAKEDVGKLKELISEWFYFLNNNQVRLEARVEELEKRLEKLELNKINGIVYEKEIY